MSKARQRISDVAPERWELAEKAFLRREAARRATDAAWRKASTKALGPKVYAIGERGWAGGLWDGEGHASASPAGFTCSMDQEDRTVLERFQATLGGLGTISKIKHRVSATGKLQFIYTWRVSNQIDLEKFWTIVGPYVGASKRDQFARALAVPLVTALRNEKALPDGVLSANVTSKKRK